MTRGLLIFALFVVPLAAAPAVRGGSIFNNFGPGYSYNTAGGNFIGNGLDGSGSNYAEGDTFTPSFTTDVSTITIALSNYFSTNTDQLQVSLTTDSGADSPGAVLASFAVLPGTLGTFGNDNAPVVFTAPAGITLSAGTQYWVTVADIGGGSDTNIWNWNSRGDGSDQAISTDGGTTWFSPSGLPPGAYEVSTAVPEPSTVVLLGSGVVGLLGLRRRLRRPIKRATTRRPETENLENRVVLSTSISWTQANFPYAGTGTMLQYPNGTIMETGELIYNPIDQSVSYDGGESNIWQVLAPSSTGSYANFSDSPTFYTSNFSRLYFATNVLPNDNIFLLGGEYSNVGGSDSSGGETNTGEMFSGPNNFSSGTGWSNIASFPQPAFGDDSSMLLNNGLILLGTGSEQGFPFNGPGITYLFNPTSSAITAMVNGSPESVPSGAYSAGIPRASLLGGLTESNSEEGWVKLPNGDVLTVDLWYNDILQNDFGSNFGGFAELFNPATGSWQDISPGDGSANGSMPELSQLVDPVTGNIWGELGPIVLLPNGNVFVIGGGTSNTALYSPTTNTWSSGPEIPYPYTSDDAPAAVLPNGDVIFTADAALENGQYTGPTAFFDYTPPANGIGAGTITQLTGSNAPDDPGLGFASYTDQMLMLPTGQLMFSDSASGETWVGTPSGAPLPQWRPVVSSITGSGSVYTLTGQRLNGMDAGAAYGDDAEMDENYPIVRLTNSAGSVYYATTSNWNNLGVATGNATEKVIFTLPAGIPAGNYSLVVSGAGIDSFPVAFHLSSISPALAAFSISNAGGSVQVGKTPSFAGGHTALFRPSAFNAETSGLRSPSPAPTDFSDSELGALPTVFSATVLDDLLTTNGNTPGAFANAVDAVFAGEGLPWLDDAPFLGKIWELSVSGELKFEDSRGLGRENGLSFAEEPAGVIDQEKFPGENPC